MLYDRKKRLMDEMQGLLDTIKVLSEANPGAGSVQALLDLDSKFNEVVLSGEDGAAAVATLEDQLSSVQAESIERRRVAQQVADRAREQRLAKMSGDGPALVQ